MIAEKAEYNYIICRDSIDIYHPNEEYSIDEILQEYKIKPTNPIALTYTKSWVYTKDEFNKFIVENSLKVRHSNNLHCEPFDTIELLILYDRDYNIKGIATPNGVKFL